MVDPEDCFFPESFSHLCFKLHFQIRDSNCNYEAFMNIIKLSDNIGELEAVRDKAAEELQYLRSLDTVGDGK